MKDTPSAALTVSESSSATGRLDATGGSVAFGAVSAGEGANVPGIPTGGPEEDPPVPIGLGIGDATGGREEKEPVEVGLGIGDDAVMGGPDVAPPVPVGLGIGVSTFGGLGGNEACNDRVQNATSSVRSLLAVATTLARRSALFL